MAKKGQAALEFLTTYAWAFIVILIVIGALYYFGVFDFSRLAPQQCIFNSQFQCTDFAFTFPEIRLKLLNNIGETVVVESLTIANDAGTPLSCDPPLSFLWDPGQTVDVVFDNCQDGNFLEGETTDALVTLTYYAPATPSQPRHEVKGTIHAHVN